MGVNSFEGSKAFGGSKFVGGLEIFFLVRWSSNFCCGTPILFIFLGGGLHLYLFLKKEKIFLLVRGSFKFIYFLFVGPRFFLFWAGRGGRFILFNFYIYLFFGGGGVNLFLS